MKPRQPNILLLFTDMQRADTIAALGNPVIRTPHLDRLVREGTTFTRCYSPSPVCVPARCCLHYGLYPQRTGTFENRPMMADNGASYPAVLGRHGFRTHAVGKCHFTPDAHALRGFQTRRTQEECTSDPRQDDYVAWLRRHGHDSYEPHGARGEMYYIPQVSTLPAAAHPTQWIGDESCRFIAQAARRRQPWCLFSSFIHPHPPFAPPKPWHKLYRAPDMPLPLLPENRTELQTWINRYQNRYKYRDRGLDLNLARVIKAYYYATISFVDFQVGRILQALEDAGQLDHTLVLFSSDHGELLGDYGCFGKRSMHDASARVPLLARLPGRFEAGATCHAAASLCDIFPTLLGAAGIDGRGLGIDGTDLSLLARAQPAERVVFSQYRRGADAIYLAADARWKYVYSAGDRLEFLFDRATDPQETRNLAGSARHAKALQGLRNDLLRHLAATGMKDAVVQRRGELAWRRHPRIDERYLRDPDAKLIFQDYPSYPTVLPGYTDAR